MSDGRLLIVKTGSTVPGVLARRGDFEHWIARAIGNVPLGVEVASVYAGDALPVASDFAGVIVTGSPAMVTAREAWSEATAAWLPSVVQARVPLLGICYGHQLLAHALGGKVGANPRGREIGTVEVDFRSSTDPLLGNLDGRISFHATHVESALELPAGARLLASNRLEPHHAFALGDRTWGVQFHPEFDADVMRGYLVERREQLEAEGLDVDRLRRATRECPEGPSLLERFAQIAHGAHALG